MLGRMTHYQDVRRGNTSTQQYCLPILTIRKLKNRIPALAGAAVYWQTTEPALPYGDVSNIAKILR